MQVVFLTNFMSHHQISFCEEMYSLLNGKFNVIAYRPIDKDRKVLGFTDTNSAFPYVIRSYESEHAKTKALLLCKNADVVIYGSAPIEFLSERRKLNKLTFVYTERLFKNGFIHLLDPRVIFQLNQKYYSQKDKNQYYMCASGYTPFDVNLVTHTPQKMYKWGYFPNVCNLDFEELFDKKSKTVTEILWVGRLIDWKHPEAVIHVAEFLKKHNADFIINVVGAGEMFEKLKQTVIIKGLQDRICLCGPKSPEEIGKYYERANIFFATSDKQEGWGAVINEAMSYGCAVVASHTMGSVPFLINNNENGIVFHSENWKDLSRKILYLINNPQKRNEISKSAYNSIKNLWNAKASAARLIRLFDAVLNNKEITFTEGPCSRAKVLTEKSFLKSVKESKHIEN